MTLPFIPFSYQLLPPLLAAERLACAVAVLFRPVRNEPGPLDPAELSPYWLRDLGLPEDYGRSPRDRLDDWLRLERLP